MFSCVSVVCLAQNFYNGYSEILPAISNPTSRTSAQFLLNQTRSDTMVITGSGLGSSYFGQINGVDSLHPFVVYYNNTSGAGIKIENCKYFKAFGVGNNHARLNSGGVPLVVTGHADYIQVSGFRVFNGAAGAIWVKTEAADACSYPTPADWLYPNHMRNIWVTDCRVGNADGTGFSSGDAFYIGSTGSKGDRPVPCMGNKLIKPMYMSTAQAIRDTVYGCRRSAIQMSGADSGVNKINYCYIYNVGSEYCALISNPPYNPQDSIAALSQGAGIRTGYGDGNNVEIAYNYVNKTFLYNLDIETGANVHDNYVDSSGFYGSCRNPQQIQNVICYAQQPNSVLTLAYNISGGHSTQPQHKSFVIYGGTNYKTTGNKVCNNTGIIEINQPFIYTTDCGVIPPVDTLYYDSTYTIIHDSLESGHFPAVTSTHTVQVFHPIDSGSLAFRTRFVIKTYLGRYEDSLVTDTIRAAFDSAIIVRNGAVHDTTSRFWRVPRTTYGLLIPTNDSITTIAQKIHQTKLLGATAARYPYDVGTTYRVQQYKDSGVYISETYNTANATIAIPAVLPLNFAPMAKTFDSLNVISKPNRVSWLNEPYLFWKSNAVDTSKAAAVRQYISGLSYIVPHAHAAGIRISDGGITQGIFNYMAYDYNNKGYSDSLNLVATYSGYSANTLLNGVNAQSQIDWYSYYIPNLRSTGIDEVNYHHYERPKVADSSLTVTSKILPLVLSFLQSRTGLPVITDETWIRNTDTGLLNAMLTEWKQYGATLIIGYDGNGTYARSSKALETGFTNFIINNP